MNLQYLTSVICFFCFGISNAQVLTYNEVSNASKKPKADFTEYHASTGDVFRIGEIINIGEPSKFNDRYDYIWLTDGFSFGENAPSVARDLESIIEKFKVQGSKNKGYEVIAVVNGAFTSNYWIYVEKAMAVGEIESSVMTRSQAIAKLKEAKDLLDLEMMTQEEYDKLKKELEPIIRGNN